MINPNHTYPSIAKFQQFVELKDYRPPTKKEYVRYVRKLAEHFGCDPLTLTEDQLRAYFLFLRQEKHYTRSPMKAAKFSLRTLIRSPSRLTHPSGASPFGRIPFAPSQGAQVFVGCRGRAGWTVFAEVRIAEPFILPVVLARGGSRRGAGRAHARGVRPVVCPDGAALSSFLSF